MSRKIRCSFVLISMFICMLLLNPGISNAQQCDEIALDVKLQVAPAGTVIDGTTLTYTVYFQNKADISIACDAYGIYVDMYMPDGTSFPLLIDASIPAEGQIICPGDASCATAGPYSYVVNSSVDGRSFPSSCPPTSSPDLVIPTNVFAYTDGTGNTELGDVALCKVITTPVKECLVDADCADDNACTTDSCVSNSCVNTPINCDDGAYCNGVETCDPQLGCVAGTPPNCNDGVACTTDACDEASDSCVNSPVNAACDDGAYCNGVETCDPQLGCVAGTPPNCNDGVACTTDTCDEASDSCVNSPVNAACNDGSSCTTDSCDPVTGCVNAPINCDDQDACTTDSCDSTSGCIHTPISCDDSDLCTTDTCDSATGCVNTAVECDDQDLCTTDSCDPATGSCVNEPVSCDDEEICTDDSCDPATGECSNVFDPTNDDSCSVGICRTPGYWGTHGGVTLQVIGEGSLSICGECIRTIDVGDEASALEAMCISKVGKTQLQLIRQLTAASLNCIMTNGSSSCDGTRNNLLFNACNNACAEGSNEVEIDGLTYQCYQALDCFNNGGEYIPETGFCKTGTCSNTGEDCNGTCPPAMVDGIPTPQACVATEGNCHDQPLCNEELSLCFDPSPSADTPKECNDATKSKCTAKGNCRTDSCE